MHLDIPSWQASIFNQWQQFLREKKLPHAILLHGTNGLGKMRLVQAMLQSLWCESQSACGNCRHCHWLAQNTHPDCRWLKPEALGKAIKIDAIREACEWLQLSPLQAQQKVLVIQVAENLNLAASNALLKTLEEPPETSLIILISEMPQKLLPTVRSRCYKMPLHLPSEAFLKDWLKEKMPGFDVVSVIPEGLGPYALLQEFSEEQSQIREKILCAFEEVLHRKTHFLLAAEKLKDFSAQDILRYAYQFMRMQLAHAYGEGGRQTLQDWLDFESSWLTLMRGIQQGANLNWQLQLELLLKKIWDQTC